MSDVMSPPFLLLFFVPLLYILRAALSRRKDTPRLPPGPPPLPIIGNLHILGNLPYRTLHRLAKQYGPIMSIKLGNVPTIVISSPGGAELVLKTHDAIFASRPVVEASKYMSYGNKGMAFKPYGAYWRSLKKMCTVHLLNAQKVEGFAGCRREEVRAVVEATKKAAAGKEAVDVSEKVGEMVERMTWRMVFGKVGREEGLGMEMQGLVKELVYLAGAFNVADYVPYVRVFDIQGLRRRMKAFAKSMDEALEKIILKHEQEGGGQNPQEMDFVDMLLSLMNHPNQQELVLDRTYVKAILIDMLVGALDTSTTTVEWAFSELLRNPRVMKKVHQELQTVVGLHRMVEETDLPNLTYLDMVIKETFRLHPTAPLLVPHESMEETVIGGFLIPKRSRIIVNVYAIGRDSDVWLDDHSVEEFLPERFEDNNVDPRGHDFRLIPFGAGRRGCPGIQMGLTFVRLVLAQLIHCFDWELPYGTLPGDLDMSEAFGLALQRASHLLAVPTYRLLS